MAPHLTLDDLGGLIDSALSARTELPQIDFKEALSTDNERLKEHVNAFANHPYGGAFVFGVTRQFERAIVEPEADVIVTKLAHLCRDTQEPQVTCSHATIATKLGDTLVVYIHPGSVRPVFIRDRPPWGGRACFERSGNHTVAMHSTKIRDLLAASREHSWDEGSVAGTSYKDLDLEKLGQLIKHDNLASYSHRKLCAVLADKRILSGETVTSPVTRAGFLVFAIAPDSHREFKNCTIDLQHFSGTIRNSPIKKLKAHGSTIEQIELIARSIYDLQWRIPTITGLKREDTPLYELQELREVLVNAVVHRSYTLLHQPVKVDLFTDRLEIENPGGLLPGLTPFNIIHRRGWRNPLLAELVAGIGYGEMDGQGIDRLLLLVQKKTIPAPQFIATERSFKVVLSAPKKWEQFSPEERRSTILAIVLTQGSIENHTLRDLFSLSLSQASNALKAMVRSGILEPTGPGRKFSQYRLSPSYDRLVYGNLDE